ncbi:hypothetical protein ABB37_09881 [Leptomonas pyrrhocoris]|uniref:FCP1 homology domain-containing protein n=1 Tax=Leptomonas pyrrhocoris TaxID=157538 RepID=A0A0N0DQN4_LEPPY|nr:hypothetical protein ABB37_09881 [Leptomonas pyrrhocoris]KPA73438.1 hypothetical protein ABB37_09881 [Leptomonas pyrrhocoris]|eukprot:XP_015651877.1 hypothetical protein ABB37_09881 [Leptomonas pyrrhocoris]
MLYDFFRFLRGVWDAVVLPYVLLSIANLATDGWEAATHLRETLKVLVCFLSGRSHRGFPLSRSALEAQRTAVTAAAGSTAAGRKTPSTLPLGPRGVASPPPLLHCSYRAGSEEENDADSEAEFPPGRQRPSVRGLSDEERRREGCTSGSTGAAADDDDGDDGSVSPAPLIQRRLLLGRKGEVEEWLPALRSRLLIPPHHPLCVSRSLHQLVSIVIGPIQQPTVSTMPTRHPEPQWPPHFLRTGHNAGGGVAGGGVGDPSTDEYSSSNSSATSSTLRRRSGHTTRYRQASSVVYQRVSSRHLDFSNSRVAPHLIASITAHHVLSYPATRQKVLVMDLDETLCYVSTTTANMAGPPTFSEVIPTVSGAELFHVWVRPYARLFLATAAKLFNLVLFTSASKPYADTILQRIDPDHLLKLRYYRQDCRLVSRRMLRVMCAAVGKRGASSDSAGRQSSNDRVGAGAREGAVGDFNPSPSEQHDDASGSGSTTSTDNDSAGGGGTGGVSSSSGAESADATATQKATTTTTCSFASSGGLLTVGNTARSSSSSSTNSSISSGGNTNTAVAATAEDLPVLEKSLINEHAKVLLKDLRILKVPPELLVLIDNSEECTLVNPENALIVSPFIPSLTKGSASEKTAVAAAAHPTRGAARDTDTPRSDPQGEVKEAASPNTAAAAVPDDARTKSASSGGPAREPTTPAEEVLLMGDDGAANDGPEEDEVLLALLPMLECLLVVPDVRSILRLGKLY